MTPHFMSSGPTSIVNSTRGHGGIRTGVVGVASTNASSSDNFQSGTAKRGKKEIEERQRGRHSRRASPECRTHRHYRDGRIGGSSTRRHRRLPLDTRRSGDPAARRPLGARGITLNLLYWSPGWSS